jgi:hypothetical protein
MKKRFLLFVVIFITHTISANYFTDLLELKEDNPNPLYYELLPEIKEENPDLSFLRSRNLKNFSLENDYLSMIEEATQAICFLETGTYLGDTTETAAKYFPLVHSIELGKDLFEKAKKRFAKKKNISLHLGDSAELLPKILQQIKDKSVIFLDAHFSMGSTVKGKDNTPILTELNHIKKSNHTNSIIIIDDIRMFYDPLITLKDNFMEGYPSLNTIVEKILEINPHYKIAIVYDTLIAFSDEEQITVSPVVRAVTISRLYDGNNYLPEHVLRAELCIAKSTDIEKEILIELAERWIEKFSESAGLSRHYALWAGLILLENENYAKAKELFLEAKKRGLKDWRIDWYIAMAEAQCFFDIR